MRAWSCVLAVGFVLVSLPAAAQPPAAKAIAGDAAGTAVARSLPADAVSGILTPFAVGPTARLGTTASVLSGAAATFAISTSRRDGWANHNRRDGWDGWANHRRPCGRDDDDDDDDDDDRGRRHRRKCPPKSPKH